MQFSTFNRSVSGNTITLKNTEPIENVQTITTYSDNSNGSFTKKELRWSFNNVYWSSWETLTPYAITHIDTHLNPYLYLEMRYILSAVGSGTVTTFSINYIVSDTALTPPIDVIQKYDITKITDASTLNGYPGSWYLNRPNHKGLQAIGTITGLQATLNSLGAGITVTKPYVDGSLAVRDASITILYNFVHDISSQVGGVEYTSNLFINDGDDHQDSLSNLDQIMGLVAPAKPDLLTDKDTSLGSETLSTTKYSAKLPYGLTSTWYTDATSGDTITDYIVDTQYRLYSPSYSSTTAACFRAGLFQDLSTMGTITAVINSVDTINFVIPVSCVGNASINTVDVSGLLACSSIAGYGGADSNFWRKAEAYIDVTEQKEGLVTYAIKHSEALTSNTVKMRYDNVNSTPSFTKNASFSEVTSIDIWLSGIKHYGVNSTFAVCASLGSGIFYKAYHPTYVVRLTSSYGSTINVNPTTTPDALATFDVSTLYTFNTASLSSSSSNPSITATAYKPTGTSAASAIAVNRRVNTYSQTRATTNVEYFTDEYRRILDGSSGTDYTWDSSNYTQFTLDGSYAQVRNGTLTYPISVDYEGTSFNGDKLYIRRFTKTAASSGTLTFSGFNPLSYLSPYGSGDVNVLIWLTDQGLYFDLGREFEIGGGDGSSMSEGISAYSSLTSTIINWTLGTYSTGNEVTHVGTYVMIIVFRNVNRTMTQITAT